MSSARSMRKFGGKNKNEKKKKNMKKQKQGNSDCDTFPPRKLQVAFGNIVAPINKPIHGL